MSAAAVSTQSSLRGEQLLRYRAARQTAERFVAQTFFTPIFKQMRNSPFRSEMFSGGRGGEVFTSMLDGMLAERMGRGVGRDLVDALVRKIDPKGAQAMLRGSSPIE